MRVLSTGRWCTEDGEWEYQWLLSILPCGITIIGTHCNADSKPRTINEAFCKSRSQWILGSTRIRDREMSIEFTLRGSDAVLVPTVTPPNAPLADPLFFRTQHWGKNISSRPALSVGARLYLPEVTSTTLGMIAKQFVDDFAEGTSEAQLLPLQLFSRAAAPALTSAPGWPPFPAQPVAELGGANREALAPVDVVLGMERTAEVPTLLAALQAALTHAPAAPHSVFWPTIMPHPLILPANPPATPPPESVLRLAPLPPRASSPATAAAWQWRAAAHVVLGLPMRPLLRPPAALPWSAPSGVMCLGFGDRAGGPSVVLLGAPEAEEAPSSNETRVRPGRLCRAPAVPLRPRALIWKALAGRETFDTR